MDPATTSESPLLSVRDLSVAFDTRQGVLDAVRDVSFDVQPGRTLGVMGESGSGRTSTSCAGTSCRRSCRS